MNPRDFTTTALSQILPEFEGLSSTTIYRIEEIFASDSFRDVGIGDRQWMEDSLVELLSASPWKWPNGEKVARAQQLSENRDGDILNYVARLLIKHVTMTGYALYRHRQLLACTMLRPYWKYEHSDVDDYPCSEHAVWDGLIFRADDAWWVEHFPPNDVGCGCAVASLNFRDLERMGKNGPDVAP